jgi:hypothetical protein
VRTAQFDRAAAWWISDRVNNGAVVAVCDVARTVVDPAHSMQSTSTSSTEQWRRGFSTTLEKWLRFGEVG